MNHTRSPKFDLELYVTKHYQKGDQDYLVVHRERNHHEPHSRIDIPVSPEIARFYETHFKQYEQEPRVRIKFGLSELTKEEDPITS